MRTQGGKYSNRLTLESHARATGLSRWKKRPWRNFMTPCTDMEEADRPGLAASSRFSENAVRIQAGGPPGPLDSMWGLGSWWSRGWKGFSGEIAFRVIVRCTVTCQAGSATSTHPAVICVALRLLVRSAGLQSCFVGICRRRSALHSTVGCR